MSALLEVRGLHVAARGRPIVDGVDLTVQRGEILGVAGESGCGKTTLALALLKLLPASLQQSGEITLTPRDGEPIAVGRRTERGMQLVRWKHISLVFQGAMNSLDPVRRIDAQLVDVLRLHSPRRTAGKAHRARVPEMLERVGLPARVGRSYAHQLSGGQRQRVMIALALACDPDLVIADEPTTALDVILQAQVLDLFRSLRDDLGLSLVLISHDLGVLAETCDRIAVMYAGRVVETGAAKEVFADPQHPYTARLIAALPVIGGVRKVFAPLAGAPPVAGDVPDGCAFRPRCPLAVEECATSPTLRELGSGHEVACHLAGTVDTGVVR